MSPEKIYQKKQKQKERKKIFRKWHRRTGFAASLFLFNLAITGILLNHYEALGLHKKHIQNSLLLDWYGVKAPQEINCVGQNQSNNNSLLVCQIDNQVYQVNSDNKASLIFENQGHLINFISTASEFFLLTNQTLNIYTKQFKLIDSIILSESEAFGLTDKNVEGLLYIEQQLIIKTNKYYLFLDEDTFELEEFTSKVSKSHLDKIEQNFLLNNQTIHQQLSDKYKKSQVSALKFVQDLHSGQILMSSGKFLTDLTGLIIMLLAISGFITWQRRKNRD